MSDYTVGVELRGFEKQFNRIMNSTHKDAITVFDDLLTFIITAFNPEPKPNPHWTYSNEHNKMFHQLMVEWISVMSVMIDRRGWYDAFGDFFMANVGKTSQQYRGQFFTPHTVCDFMSKVSLDEKGEYTEPRVDCGGFGKRVIVNDCACGSARLLLAAHATNCERGKRPYYFIGEDIDRMCCKMAAINMCAHGCFGEVVCHDTLKEPDGLNFGYVINEGLYPVPGCPTIREFEDPTRFVSIRAARQWVNEAVSKKTKKVDIPDDVRVQSSHGVPTQLTLNFFD